ncbi:efflux RND transporter periplasmic adaptor subunit [Endozoicomonas sp. SM1973]|uniref:Efflux RND transporter periplasmic adaptor subunit n=1 Tax=Spartinivicinus marinus TaxID=2994442 RepID=A0A853I3W6_9GAMM|nr:efflux RND transporter periplasmic adaptor subunit [Spartinivicinus marinus]NYZ68053.1 efflux RND transporter periplasmic adaptor subunit [Spartinivicinus marinus]
MKKTFLVIVLVGLGFTGGYFAQQWLPGLMGASGVNNSEMSESSAERKPLYWVAPMDPNYKRDKPGLSPMGMDLVPVYPEDAAGKDEPGLVKIDATVENNLGVKTAKVMRQKVASSINTVGYISHNEDKLHHMHTRVEGWIEKLNRKAVGDPVEQGDIVFELYSPTLVNAQYEFLSLLKTNNKGLIAASKERLMALGLDGQAIKQLVNTQQVRQRIQIRAPMSGYVTKLGVREGMYVKPMTQIMEIGDLSEVWVIAEVFARQASLIQPGQPATMRTDFLPGRNWQGKVDYIYPDLDSTTRTFKVRLRFPNQALSLKPNMFVHLAIDAKSTQPTLLIPNAALIRSGTMNRVVKALGDGKYQSITVTTGKETGQQVEILSGLKEGDRIVTSAQFLIDSESSITADFNRMETAEKMPETASVVLAKGVWNKSIAADQVNITHDPIEAWNWPAMTMNFQLDKSVSTEAVKNKQAIDFCIQKLNNQYLITDLSTKGDLTEAACEKTAKAISVSTDMEGMDHSKMDHSKMDHSQHQMLEAKDEKPVDHSTMDHSQMDHSQHQTPKTESEKSVDHSTMDHSNMNHTNQ